MNLEFAFLCDTAQESGGKIHALGIGFDTIGTQQVPVVHPMLTVVAQVRYTMAEAGQKSLAIRLIDADGRNVVNPIDGTIAFPDPSGRPASIARLIIALGGVNFTSFGDYAVHIAINGTEIASLPLSVARMPAPE